MKKFKDLYPIIYLALLTILFVIFCIIMPYFYTKKASALELGIGGDKRFTSGQITMSDGTTINGFNSFGDFVFTNIPEAKDVTNLQLNFETALSGNNAVLGSFTITYDFKPATQGSAGSLAVENIKYYGLDLSNALILNDSCISSTLASSMNGSEGTLTCTYLIMTSFKNQTNLVSAPNSRIFMYRSAGYNASANLIISNFTYRSVSWNAFTDSDKEWLEDILSNSGVQDTSAAIQEVQDKAQQAADDAQQNADSAQGDNESATDSLFNVLGSVIQALGTPATNCKIRADMGNVDLGYLDFCSGKPNEFIPIINTAVIIGMILAIWGIAHSLINDFINLTRFAQGN